jgi:hypothetical protein
MRGRILTLLTGVLVGAIVAGGAAIAITSTAFTYSSTKTGYLALSTMAFAPNRVGSTGAGDFTNDWTGSAQGISSPDGSRCFSTGVNLPNGSRIRSVRYSFTSGPGANLRIELVRVNPATGASTFLAQAEPLNDAGARRSFSTDVPSTKQLVDNQTFVYGFGVCAQDDTTVHGARITYTYRNAGD